MNPWIKTQTHLAGQTVTLLPLQESHLDDLARIARDERIWEFYTVNCGNQSTFLREFNGALDEQAKGSQVPFVIFHNEDQQLIGSTRFLNIQSMHRKLEIGWTWLQPGYWATEVNAECKLLLLTCCFEELSAVRVQIKTDEANIRSRKAIEKAGGVFEGILRNDMVRENKTCRNSAYYSIIEHDWPHVKEQLVNLYWTRKARTEKHLEPWLSERCKTKRNG